MTDDRGRGTLASVGKQEDATALDAGGRLVAERPRAGAQRLSRRRLLGAGALAGGAAAAGSAAWVYAGAPETPWYVTGGSERVRRAYAFAVERPDVLRYLPCFCGCGRHDGHGSVLDCFVAGRDWLGRVRYDDHGVGCEICLAVVLDGEAKLAEGKRLAEVRAEIDRFYAPWASFATDTPSPPGEGSA